MAASISEVISKLVLDLVLGAVKKRAADAIEDYFKRRRLERQVESAVLIVVETLLEQWFGVAFRVEWRWAFAKAELPSYVRFSALADTTITRTTAVDQVIQTIERLIERRTVLLAQRADSRVSV